MERGPSTPDAGGDEPRVLLLADAMHMGGGQMVYLRRARWLHRAGIPVAFAGGSGELLDDIRAMGIPTTEIPELGLHAPEEHWRTWGATVRTVLDIVDEHAITVINAMPMMPVMAAREVARVRDVGVLFEFLATQMHITPTAPYIDEVWRGNFSLPSGPCRHEIEQRLHVPNRLLHTLELGVEVAAMAEVPAATVRAELGLADDDLLVANVSRHDWDKVANILALVDAMAELMPSRPNLHLLLVGDGGEHDRLVSHAEARLDPARLHLLPTRSPLAGVVHGADVVFAVGSVAYEAAAAGTPVVLGSGNATGIIDHTTWPRDHYSTGYWGDSEDDACGDEGPDTVLTSIAARLAPLLDDPAEHARIAEQGRRRMSGHDLDVTMPAWVATYREVHAARARRNTVTPRVWAAAGDVEVGTTADAGEAAIVVSLAPPHDPAATVAPWERWAALVEPLRAYGIDAQLRLAPDVDHADSDLAIFESITLPATIQSMGRAIAGGARAVVVGRYRDERRSRHLARPMHALVKSTEHDPASVLREFGSGEVKVNGVVVDRVGGREDMDLLQGRVARLAHAYVAADEGEVEAFAAGTDARPDWLEWDGDDDRFPEGDAARFLADHGVAPGFVLALGSVMPPNGQAIAALATTRPLTCIGDVDMNYHFDVARLARGGARIIGRSDDGTCTDALAAAGAFVHVGPSELEPRIARMVARSGVPIALGEGLRAPAGANVVARFDPFDVPAVGLAIEQALAAPRTANRLAEGPDVARRARLLARVVHQVVPGRVAPRALYERSAVVELRRLADLHAAIDVLVTHPGDGELECVFVDVGTLDGTADLLGALSGDVQVVRIDAGGSSEDAAEAGRARARGAVVTSIVAGDPEQLTLLAGLTGDAALAGAVA